MSMLLLYKRCKHFYISPFEIYKFSFSYHTIIQKLFSLLNRIILSARETYNGISLNCKHVMLNLLHVESQHFILIYRFVIVFKIDKFSVNSKLQDMM